MIDPTAFTPHYYLRMYPDVAASQRYGSYSEAKDHYNKYGKKEGRSPNFLFDPAFYQEHHKDVRDFYGENQWEKLQKHWLKYGNREGRRGALLKFITSIRISKRIFQFQK